MSPADDQRAAPTPADDTTQREPIRSLLARSSLGCPSRPRCEHLLSEHAVDDWDGNGDPINPRCPTDDIADVRDPANETHRTSAAGGTDCVHPELDGPCSGCAPTLSRDEIVDRFTAAVDNACDVAAIEVVVHELEPGPHGWQHSGQTSPLRRLVRALEGAGLLDAAALDDTETR